MKSLDECSLQDQRPKDQFDVLRSFERNDRVTVVLAEKGSLSGTITSVIENGESDEPDEVHVQFLDHDSHVRDDDMPHHTVSVTKTEDGDYERAELSYSVSDMGRVRMHTVDDAVWVWPDLKRFRQTTLLSSTEVKLVLLKEMGLSEAEMAEQWGCDEGTIAGAMAGLQKKYWKAQETVERLDASPIEPSQFPSSPISSDIRDRVTEWKKQRDDSWSSPDEE